MSDKETGIVRSEPTTIEIIQQVLASGGKATEMAAVVKELVALKQSEERFQWEREERQAKIDFDDALNRCQSAVDRIAPNRTRENNIGWLDYAGLDKVLRPIYSREGFSISYSEETPSAEGRLNMKATLSRSGISRDYMKEFPTAAPNGKMSIADAEASAASRVKRYLMLQIFNIAVGIDRDEKKPFEEKQPMDEKEFAGLMEAIEAADSEKALKDAFFKAAKRAREIGDSGALKSFEAAKNETWRQNGGWR